MCVSFHYIARLQQYSERKGEMWCYNSQSINGSTESNSSKILQIHQEKNASEVRGIWCKFNIFGLKTDVQNKKTNMKFEDFTLGSWNLQCALNH